MKFQIKTVAVLVSIVFLVIGLFVNQQLIGTADVLKKEKTNLAEILSYKNRFLDKEEWLKVQSAHKKDLQFNKNGISLQLPFVSSEQQKAKLKDLQTSISMAQQKVHQKTTYVGLLILAYLLIIIFFYWIKKPPFLPIIASITISILCLHVGLFTPMLEIGAVERDFNLADIPIQKKVMGFDVQLQIQKKFEGDLYFYYQSKSIFNLIHLLFKQGNLVVGICILLFSVLFPIVKTLLMCFYVIRPSIKQKKWFSNFVLNLSKWSMADVFVVAIFLGFLAFENMQAGIQTFSNVCMGLYFFLAYCILSIAGSVMAKMSTEENIQVSQ